MDWPASALRARTRKFIGECRLNLKPCIGYSARLLGRLILNVNYSPPANLLYSMRCGQRLWVSEVQAQPSTVKREDGWLPADRPNSRKVCECVPDFTEYAQPFLIFLYSDISLTRICRNGLTKIFASTADAQTSYNPETQKRIGKERPDAVYGLQRTRRFEELLRGLPDPNARCTIYENNEIIFPFLILEAKSETSKDNFHDINNQTGLAIREMLNLQIELFKLAGRSYGENVGPIVWYIATRGDLWKIHVAYVNMVQGKPHYVSDDTSIPIISGS